MTDDKFNKEYKYNIRHSYGLEGKRANYPAKKCVFSASSCLVLMLVPAVNRFLHRDLQITAVPTVISHLKICRLPSFLRIPLRA